jgi:hypothetical protein
MVDSLEQADVVIVGARCVGARLVIMAAPSQPDHPEPHRARLRIFPDSPS